VFVTSEVTSQKNHYQFPRTPVIPHKTFRSFSTSTLLKKQDFRACEVRDSYNGNDTAFKHLMSSLSDNCNIKWTLGMNFIVEFIGELTVK